MATVTLIAGLGGSSSFVNPKDEAQKLVCLQHLNSISQALQMGDLQGQPLPNACLYPKTPTVANHLAKVMEGKVAAQAFLCPCAPAKLKQHKITYIYNSKLAGKMMSEVPNASQTWVLADISLVDPKLPGSHNGGACVLFADGQARWVARDKQPNIRK